MEQPVLQIKETLIDRDIEKIAQMEANEDGSLDPRIFFAMISSLTSADTRAIALANAPMLGQFYQPRALRMNIGTVLGIPMHRLDRLSIPSMLELIDEFFEEMTLLAARHEVPEETLEEFIHEGREHHKEDIPGVAPYVSVLGVLELKARLRLLNRFHPDIFPSLASPGESSEEPQDALPQEEVLAMAADAVVASLAQSMLTTAVAATTSGIAKREIAQGSMNAARYKQIQSQLEIERERSQRFGKEIEQLTTELNRLRSESTKSASITW